MHIDMSLDVSSAWPSKIALARLTILIDPRKKELF